MTEAKAILYARVSTRGQAEEGYSLRQQMEALRGWAEAEGYAVLEEVEDAGHSGASLQRPGLDRVRDLVAAGGISVVVAQDRDRFSREPAYTYLLRREFEERGTRMRSLNDRGDESPEGELTDGILDQLAKFERAKIAERSRRGKTRKAAEGKVLRGPWPPFGFRYTEDGDGLIVDPERMAVVRDVFRMIGGAGMTMGEAQRRLNRRGVPSPMAEDRRRWKEKNSGKWSVSTLRKMVLSPLYRPLTVAEVAASGMAAPEVARSLDPEGLYGLWRWGRAYAPISLGDEGPSRAMVDTARDRIGQGERRPPSTIAHRFWQLSGGIVRCGECGSVLSPKARPRPSGKIDSWYFCRQKWNNGARDCTHGTMYRAAELEETVWGAVYGLLSDPDRLRSQHEQARERARREMRGDPDREARDLAEELTKLERMRDGHLDQQAEGLISMEKLREKLSVQDERRGELERALRSARNRQESMEEFKRAWSFVDKQLLQMTDGLSYLLASPADRRRLYMGLQLRADVDADGTIRLSGIFDPEIILLDLVQDFPTDPSEPDPEPLEGARVVTTPYTSSPPRR